MNLRHVLKVTVASVGILYLAQASATNFTSVVYDEKLDKLIVKIAYRGTHGDHQFSIQWGECRRLDDDRFQTYGLLVDSEPMDLARQEFSKVLEIGMISFPCRPAKITVRTAAGFNRSIEIPKPKRAPL